MKLYLLRGSVGNCTQFGGGFIRIHQFAYIMLDFTIDKVINLLKTEVNNHLGEVTDFSSHFEAEVVEILADQDGNIPLDMSYCPDLVEDFDFTQDTPKEVVSMTELYNIAKVYKRDQK